MDASSTVSNATCLRNPNPHSCGETMTGSVRIRILSLMVDMPERLCDLLFRFLHNNGGKLS